MPDALLDDLRDWLRIPSISTGEGDPAELERAAQWVVDRMRAAGGQAGLVRYEGLNPLVVGELRASSGEDAPTVIAYGHYDVQGPGDLSLWTSSPFEPEVRDGRLYARGAADDKGNVLPLIHAACELARAGELPVNVRVVVEGEEEAGGAAVERWVREDARGADVAVVFDSCMAAPDTPAITVGLRGVVFCQIEVRTAERDLHSGLYGGSVLNALHVVHRLLAELVPGEDGRVREELRAGIEPPSDAERESWARLEPGEALLAAAGARPVHPGAGAEYYERNGADASLDINEVRAGEPRTVIPSTAHAAFSLRLAPRQDPIGMRDELERLLRAALPAGAEMTMSCHIAEPALFEPSLPALRLAAEGIRRGTGLEPAFVRSGGSIPVVAQLAARGIPVVVSGFTLPDDPIHAPDESVWLRGLELGAAASREMLRAFAELPRA
jgi:acetylornithine deacetylase/succinyl-diaminopimelate desuccinylase-like protein